MLWLPPSATMMHVSGGLQPKHFLHWARQVRRMLQLSGMPLRIQTKGFG